MSVLDTMKSKVKEYTDPDGPGAELLHSAKGKLSHGIDGASKFVDEKTNGKYSDTIHTSVGKAKGFLGDKPQGGGSESSPGAQAPGGAPAGAQDQNPEDSARRGGPDPGSDGSSPPQR